MAMYKNLKKALGDIPNATTLNIKVNATSIPSELTKLVNLEALYIKSDKLTELDFDFQSLQKLKLVYIHGKNIETLPQSLLTHPCLETLSVSECHIKRLDLVPNLQTNIKTLMLNKNALTEIPLYLEHLESLESLNLSDNRLTTLPERLRLLNSLKNLSINRNQLKDLPIELVKNWKSLKSLSLDGNQFSEETKETIEKELNYWFGEI